MDLKFKILVFGAQWNASTAHTGDLLRFMFRGRLPVGKEIGYYESIAEALPEFTSKFQGTDVVLLLADISDYAHIKDLLAKALHLQLRSAPEIAKNTRLTIGDFESGSEEMLAHCAVPAGKPTFCMGDGLYAGFAVTAGRQNMIFLPHDSEHTIPLLNQQVIPYLNTFYGADIPTDASRTFYANELCAMLDEQNERMGVSGTKTSVFIRNAVQHIAQSGALLRFTPSAEARGSLPPSEYAANLSIAACELEGCPYGVAMTNAFFAGPEATADTAKSVYLAFTDDNDTNVKEICSYTGEDLENFLQRSTEELFKFAIERIRIMHHLAPRTEESVQTDEPKKGGRIALLTVIAVLATAASMAVSFFVTDHILQTRAQQPQSDISEQATQEATAEEATSEELPSEEVTSEEVTAEEVTEQNDLPTDAAATDAFASEAATQTVIDLDL